MRYPLSFLIDSKTKLVIFIIIAVFHFETSSFLYLRIMALFFLLPVRFRTLTVHYRTPSFCICADNEFSVSLVRHSLIL